MTVPSVISSTAPASMGIFAFALVQVWAMAGDTAARAEAAHKNALIFNDFLQNSGHTDVARWGTLVRPALL